MVKNDPGLGFYVSGKDSVNVKDGAGYNADDGYVHRSGETMDTVVMVDEDTDAVVVVVAEEETRVEEAHTCASIVTTVENGGTCPELGF